MGIRFRESAVNNIRSAKRTDQDIRLVSIRMWILLIVSVVLVGGLLAWGILGRVPITTELSGVYTYSLGRTEICAEKCGVISNTAIRGLFVGKGELLCKFKDGTEMKANDNCVIQEALVSPGQYVHEGDVIYTAYRTPEDGKCVERAYLFVPYEQKPIYKDYLPVQVDLQGVSEDTSRMQGFTYGNNNMGTISKEEAKRQFGMPEIDEIFKDGGIYTEIRCLPLNMGTLTDGELIAEYMKDMTGMGWMSALVTDFFSGTMEDRDLIDLDAVYLPDMTAVKATVTLEYRRPITLLIPALQSVFKPISAAYDEMDIDWNGRPVEPIDPCVGFWS